MDLLGYGAKLQDFNMDLLNSCAYISMSSSLNIKKDEDCM